MTGTRESVELSALAKANDAPPEGLSRPTFAPAAMALGIGFFFWGLVTSVVVFGAGVLFIVASLAAWIGEMRHEP
jgi:hypothetical protein